MSFEELLEQLAEDYLNPRILPDGRKDADHNGHTRITELQQRYGLSSLKVQKLLVTAGVYEPVKADSCYFTVKRLYEAGKSMEEIMVETGLSKASVNACLPYERGAKELDKLGLQISDDAARKRKQRGNEEMKMENARNRLALDFTDDSFWYALGEHDKVVFVTAEGQRFHIKTTKDSLDITPIDDKAEAQELIWIAKKEVLNLYHQVLASKAQGVRIEDLGYHGKYILPLLVYLGVLEGDRGLYTTKRKVKDDTICSCCGRKAARLFTISSFSDLCTLQRQFDHEREARWSDDERQMSALFQTMGITSPSEEIERRTVAMEEKAGRSEVVQAFNADGERRLCEMCAIRLYQALEGGDQPPVADTGDYENLPVEMVLDYVFRSVVMAEDSYKNIFGKVLKPEDFDNNSNFLFKTVDKDGLIHFFSMTATATETGEGDQIASYRAMEVHKVTKAGRLAFDNARTDYDINHYKRIHAEDNFQQKILVGLLELEEKIKKVLMLSSLYSDDSGATNLVTVGNKHYGIGHKGQIIPVYVGNLEPNYMSLRNREWSGDEYGFLIDGMLFSGGELALMCSGSEGSQIRFSCEEPGDPALGNDEFLMPVRLNNKVLVNETVDLINMFTVNGSFEREKDKENFRKMFTGVLEKLKLYHDSYGYGYGKLAGMAMIKQLEWVDGMEMEIDRVREVIRD